MNTLVRFWENGFQDEVAAEFVDWDQGWFHLKSDTPLARRVFDTADKGSILLTVYSTDELVWALSSASANRWGFTTVHCVPWLERMRQGLMSDDYMVWRWLEAEKRWVAS